MTCWRDHPQGDAWSSLKTGIEKLMQEKDARQVKEIKVLKNRCRELNEHLAHLEKKIIKHEQMHDNSVKNK